MVDVDKAVIARLEREGNVFEILVDCDKALEFKEGKGVIDDCLAGFNIFKDAKKGEKASESLLEKVFKTTDFRKIAEIIIKKGFIQVTAKHRNKESEMLRKQIINLIHRNVVDSKTGLPHPVVRIENAINEAKIKIDNNKTAEEQIEEIVDKLRVLIPIKFEKLKLSLKLPAQYANSSFKVLKKYGKILRQDWQNNGGLLAMIEIPAGIQDDFFSEINKVCHGDVESKIIKEE